MIRDNDDLKQAIEQLGRMYRALAALRGEVFPLSQERFALMAEGPLDEIRQLQRQIDEYSGVLSAEEASADVWMRIEGRDIAWPLAPASVLTALVDAIRKGIQAVAEILATGQLATRPTGALKRACDFRVIAMQPGSLRVGLRLPEENVTGQMELIGQERVVISARDALKKYLATMPVT